MSKSYNYDNFSFKVEKDTPIKEIEIDENKLKRLINSSESKHFSNIKVYFSYFLTLCFTGIIIFMMIIFFYRVIIDRNLKDAILSFAGNRVDEVASFLGGFLVQNVFTKKNK
jgi:hypothetical protein